MRAVRDRDRPSRWLALLVAALIGLSGFAVPARAWWNGDWSYRKEITVDAGATGGNLPSDAGRMPVLIRLHDGNFKFGDAKEDGTDLRFIASDDKTPLNFHVETFDPVLGVGLIWVDVPDIKAGATLKFWMYYGNSKSAPGGDPKAAYDANQVLVYHFGEKGTAPRDWTAYGNTALKPVPSDSGSLIGAGAKLDGTTAVQVPAKPSMALAEGGAMTFTAWIRPDDNRPAILLARHDAAGGAFIVGLDQGKPYVSVQAAGGAAQRGDATEAIAPAQWHHLAVTADQQVTLYVDGQPRETLPVRLPALGGDTTIGGDANGETIVSGFVGGIDEVGIAKAARPAGFIRALFANEGPDSKFVQFGQDEQNSAFGGGYFIVILKSVTTDGWVIIGILLIMAAISWWVMADRARYIGGVAKSNKAFLAAYARAGRDVFRFDRMLAGAGAEHVSRAEFARIEAAPLYRLLSVGLEELRERMGDAAHIRHAPLTEPAIEAIRATMDATLIREIQALNQWMVLLTVAISGGPFIGLLGTVVGVMITFAAIAVAGDVNVNSIAPGIAAAMVATCAGLFVAIPALFGYNYLLTRVKEETASMTVFLDQFVARLAELSHGSSGLGDLAAE